MSFISDSVLKVILTKIFLEILNIFYSKESLRKYIHKKVNFQVYNSHYWIKNAFELRNRLVKKCIVIAFIVIESVLVHILT